MKRTVLIILLIISGISLRAQDIINVDLAHYFRVVTEVNFSSSNSAVLSKSGGDIIVSFSPTTSFWNFYSLTESYLPSTARVADYMRDEAYPWISVNIVLPEDGEAYFSIAPNTSTQQREFYIEGDSGYVSVIQYGSNTSEIYSIVNTEINYMLPLDEISIILSGSDAGRVYTLINTANPQIALATKKGTGTSISFDGNFGTGTFRIKCESQYMTGQVTYNYPEISVPASSLNTTLNANGGELYFWMYVNENQYTYENISNLINKLNSQNILLWRTSHIYIEDSDPGAFLFCMTYGPNISPNAVVRDTGIPLTGNRKLAFTQTGGGNVNPSDIIWNVSEGHSFMNVLVQGINRFAEYQLYHNGQLIDSRTSDIDNLTLTGDGAPGRYSIAVYYDGTIVEVGDHIIEEPFDLSKYNWTKESIYTNSSHFFENITYYDGLGRPEQIIEIGAAPVYTEIGPTYYVDRITPIYYDHYGRQSKDYLPFSGEHSLGTYRENAVKLQQMWYNEKYADNSSTDFLNGQAVEGLDYVNFSFSEKEYDSSPLNHIKRVWHVGRENRNASACTEFDISSNYDDHVYRMWAEEDNSLKTFWRHYTGTMYKTTEVNEDGCATYTYTDQLGRTILMRKEDTTDPADVKLLDTYYVYDLDDRLRWVISPEGSSLLEFGDITYSVDSDLCKKYCYVYCYDDHGNIIASRNPGSDWVEMVYDHSDRLVAMQDYHARQANQWHMYYYDQLNRLQWERLVTFNNSKLNTYINQFPHYSQRDLLDFYIKHQEGSFANMATLDEAEAKIIGQYQYDKYSNIIPLLYFEANIDWPAYSSKVKSYITYEKTAILNSDGVPDNYVERAYYYDDDGRVIQTVEKNHLGGISRYSTKYDYVGNVLIAHEWHQTDMNDVGSSKTSKFKYDDRGRILSERSSINDKTQWVPVSNKFWVGYDNSKHMISPDFGDYLMPRMINNHSCDNWADYSYINPDGKINESYFLCTENGIDYYYFPETPNPTGFDELDEYT